jgi:glycosyltransferase involved in cell wall biosynthesis
LRAAEQGVVHNGIPMPEDRDRIRRQRLPGSRFRFLMLTRLTVEKGVQTVLDAVARVPKDIPIEVTIAGKGPLEDVVRSAAAADARIRYLGFVDGEAKAEALTWAGNLVLPSLWYETASTVILEAAAYGLGVIGSDIGGIPEFIEPNQTGLLFPPGDSAALAAIMTRHAQDPNLLPALTTRTDALARHFTVERMIDSYEAHYATLFDRQSARLAAE